MQPFTSELRDLLKSKLQASSDGFRVRATYGAADTPVGPPIRVSIDKSLRMTADQLELEFHNEDLPLGWATTSVFPTNERIKVWQWYGDEANAVQTFTGIVDKVVDARDPLNTIVKCRDLMGIMVDQTFSTSGPQQAGEAGAIRTPANGVFLSMEVADILAFILDQVGWPAEDRDITITSFVLTEYIVVDGTSWAQAVIGKDALTGLTGYDAWADEFGVFHFAPTPSSDLVSVTPDVSYVWQAGVDIVSLSDSTDQYELITRVKTRGPLTTLKNAWSMLWQTRKIADPVGIWFDPSQSAYIFVVDNNSRRIYKLRQSDRQIVSSWSIALVCPHPLGISGDPADPSVYWLLNAPWIDGGSGGNTVVKMRKSDNHELAHYAIPDGRWSAIKVSAAFMWLTNLDTDHFYKRSKANASAIANYRHTYNSVLQSNPSGLMIDGTTLHLFWANGGTTARFLLCDESAPTAITGAVATAGSTLHGGEMDTTTHTECWGDNDSLGLVAKFSLFSPTTMAVSAEIVDIDLEDELGALAELEDRVHDAHPGDAAHPWESRRYSLDLTVIDSLAQAADVARFTLDKMGRRNRVLDAGILGNPAVQKNDLVQVQDPVSGVFQNFVVDTYRSEMLADQTYLGTLSLVRGGVANDAVTEPLPPPTDGGGDGEPIVAPFYAGEFPLQGDTEWVAFSQYDTLGHQNSDADTCVLAPLTTYTYDVQIPHFDPRANPTARVGLINDSLTSPQSLFVDLSTSNGYWGGSGLGPYHYTGTFTTPDSGSLKNPYRMRASCQELPHGHDVMGTVIFDIEPA